MPRVAPSAIRVLTIETYHGVFVLLALLRTILRHSSTEQLLRGMAVTDSSVWIPLHKLLRLTSTCSHQVALLCVLMSVVVSPVVTK